jgi:DNA-binding SARP family transcriptional activator
MRFRLLGSIDVVDGDRAVGVGGGRQRALLAALLLRPNEVVSTERLIGELWGEHRTETATTALHGLVSTLRKALEDARSAEAAPTVIVTRESGYMLCVDEGDIDAVEFERLLASGRQALAAGEAGEAADTFRGALALWRGPALTEVADREFARIEAQRLDELRVEALEERIEADLLLGRSHELVPELEALVAREPLRERPCGLLMRALYASGRQADALDVYRQLRRRLVDDLGLEPGRPLQELEQAILRQDPALDEVSARIPPPGRDVRRRRVLRTLLAVAAAGVAMALVAAFVFDRGQPPALAGVDPNHLGVIDPHSNKIVAEIAVGQRPAAVATGHGSVWVANAGAGTVTRINPRTRRTIATIGIGEPASSLAVTKNAVWVGNGSDGTVYRIDPSSNTWVQRIDLRGRNPVVPNGVQSLAAGDHAVWVAVGPSKVARLDARSGNVEWIPVGSPPQAIAFGAGAVWVATGGEHLLRIDPTSDEQTASRSIRYPEDVAVGLGSVWVMDGQLTAFDSSGAMIPEGGVPAGFFTLGVSTGFNSAWSVAGEGTLYRTDASDLQKQIAISLGNSADAVTTGYGEVWVCVQ